MHIMCVISRKKMWTSTEDLKDRYHIYFLFHCQVLFLSSPWPVSGDTCVMCGINAKAMAQCGCWNLDLHTLRQHILLGRLVHWWSFSGLVPQYPGDALDDTFFLSVTKRNINYDCTICISGNSWIHNWSSDINNAPHRMFWYIYTGDQN